MNDQIQESKKQLKKSHQKNIQKWQRCDVMDLARTFFDPSVNQLGSEDSQQFVKVAQIVIGKKDVKRLLFRDLVPEKNSFKIEMGLSKGKGKRLLFAPVFTVDNKGKKKSAVFSWEPKQLGDAEIPYQLMKDLTNNWNTLENHLLDDVFMAKGENSDSMKRLMSYHFSPKSSAANQAFYTAVYSLISKGYTISKIIMHMGVDFNKFSNVDRYSFSPILELKYKKSADTSSLLTEAELLEFHRLGARLGPDTDPDDGSLLIEYLTPCPSTCDSN